MITFLFNFGISRIIDKVFPEKTSHDLSNMKYLKNIGKKQQYEKVQLQKTLLK